MPDRLMAALPPLELDPERIRELTREVLSRPAYDDLQRNALERWVDELRLRAAEFLADLLGSASGTVLAWAVAAFGAAVLLLLAFLLLRRLRPEPTAPAEAVAPAGRSAADWTADAEAHEAEGRWREAVRAHFRAVTAALVERGVVDDVPGTTVGEYREVVRTGAPALAAPFDDAAAAFEAVWYAHAPADRETAARVRRAAASFGPAGVGVNASRPAASTGIAAR